jgi:phosphate transport system ATP-binding protein
MEAKMVVKDFNLQFLEKQVLKNINIDFPDKKIIALIGPSGSGKSTLLRGLNRMHDLNPKAKIKGDVLLDGQSIYGSKVDPVEVRRKIGMVFQKPNPFPKSIYKNVAYGLTLGGGMEKSAIDAIVVDSIKDCALWDEVGDDLDKSALELSGGQQQRLCIARSIAVKPEVILMDEPCSALDPISTAKIESLMLKLREEYCIVIVTHNMQQAQRVADYTAFMYWGEVIEYAETKQLFENPQQELTRKYLDGNFG